MSLIGLEFPAKSEKLILDKPIEKNAESVLVCAIAGLVRKLFASDLYIAYTWEIIEFRQNPEFRVDIGSPTWARTRDLRINSPSLYQLSYRGFD